MRLDVVSVPAERSLTDYLGSGWMENVDPASVEEFASMDSRRPPRPPAAKNGHSVCSPCGSAARSIVSSSRREGGRISIATAPGKYTRFAIQLPAQSGQQGAVA